MNKFLDFTNSLGINNAGPGGLLSVINGLNSIPYINEGVSIVDFGCNTGFTTMAIARRFPNAKVVGIDISEKYLDDAKSELQNLKELSNVSFVQGDVSKLDLQNDCVDIILCCGLFGFVESPELVIEEINRVLKPDGYALIVDYFYGDQKPNQDLATQLIDHIEKGLDKFTFNYWINLLKTQFLEVVGIDCKSLKYRKDLNVNTIVESYIAKRKLKENNVPTESIEKFRLHTELIIKNFEFLNQGSFLVRKNVYSSFDVEHPTHN